MNFLCTFATHKLLHYQHHVLIYDEFTALENFFEGVAYLDSQDHYYYSYV